MAKTKINVLMSYAKLDNKDSIEILFEDVSSGAIFLELNLTSDQMMNFLSRLHRINVSGAVSDLELVGKTLELKTLKFEFEFESSYNRNEKNAEAYKKALIFCPEGWVVDNYFDSQTSFFNIDNKPYARCTIRRWV